jgi:4-amino-4-deoxy-L-arabinose transferase-like glycosyltransferase
MLQAYLVLPALAAVYLLGAPARWRTRFRDLLLALLVLLAVSFVWIVAVDLVPAAQRPFISDSGTNSELSLVFGYNGLGRLTQALFPGLSSIHLFGSTIDLTIVPAFAPEIGNPGWLRLFSPAVGGQASWFLVLWGGWLLVAGVFFSTGRFFHLYYLVMLGPPIAALAGIGFPALWRLYRQHAGGHWWQRAGAWLLPVTLVATALVQLQLLNGYPQGSVWPVLLLGGGSLLAAAVLAAALLHLEVQMGPGTTLGIPPRAAAGITAVALCGLLVAPAAWGIMAIAAGQGGAWLPQAGPSTGGAGGPGGFGSHSSGGRFGANGGRFSFTPGTAGTIPGGPGQAPAAPGTTPDGRANTGSAGTRQRFGTGFPGGSGFGGGGGSSGAMTYAGTQTPTLDAGLLRYLRAHQGKDTYLVATTTSSYASLFILQTTQPAMALGGYQGWDRILTPATLAKAVAGGTVRFFYLPAARAGAFSGTGGGAGPSRTATGATSNLSTVNDDLVTWVRAHCTVVSSQTYDGQAGGTAAGRPAAFSGGMQLYDCAAQR